MTPVGNAGHGARFPYIDLLKAFASQFIVLHHLAFYGPMADFVRPAAPSLIDWLAGDARIAVQVFLVVGGFLAAKALCSSGQGMEGGLISAIFRRWTKLVPPYAAAILLAAGASGAAAMLMNHHSISVMHGWRHLFAHFLLMQDVLGYEALSAGMWYVAIDFQLYASLAAISWGCGLFRRDAGGWLLPAAVITAGALSLAIFNRVPEFDVWAVYFFGSYSLGILAWWASDPQRSRAEAMVLGLAMIIVGVGALEIEFRARIAVALIVALLLLAGRRGALAVPRVHAINFLARISYALLLVHFPVSLIINAVVIRLLPHEPLAQGTGMIAAWCASLLAAAAFHRWLEIPMARPVARMASAMINFAGTVGTMAEAFTLGLFMRVFRG